MKVVIAGKNNIAIDVANEILASYLSADLYVIFNENDSGVDGFQRSFKKYAQDKKLKITDLKSAYKMEDMIFLSLEFDKIISPDKFLSRKLYNIHFSKLPAYKGMYTSAWPIINNEVESGVTLHYIDSGIDTGDMICRKTFSLDLDETAKSLYDKYISIGTDLVISSLNELINHEPKGMPQSYIGSSYYSKKSIDYTKLSIDTNKAAIEVKKQIDAFSFREYQVVNVFGFDVFGVEIKNEKSTVKPGLIIEDNENYLVVSTVDYNIKVYKDRFPMLLELCESGNLSEVNAIINGFNVNEKNSFGWSPIIVAAYNGHIEIVELLLRFGAKINDCNYKGTSVFMYAKDYALNNDDIDFLKRLIEFGADPYLNDHCGLNVFDYVKKKGDVNHILLMSEFK